MSPLHINVDVRPYTSTGGGTGIVDDSEVGRRKLGQPKFLRKRVGIIQDSRRAARVNDDDGLPSTVVAFRIQGAQVVGLVQIRRRITAA